MTQFRDADGAATSRSDDVPQAEDAVHAAPKAAHPGPVPRPTPRPLSDTTAEGSLGGSSPSFTAAVPEDDARGYADGPPGDGTGGGDPKEGAGGGPARGPVGALLSLLRETVTVVVIALGLSLLIKTFLVQAFFIPSESMENTLLIGDRVLVSKLTPGPFDVERGDIVVFSDPGEWLDLPPRQRGGAVSEGFRKVLMFVGLLPADSGDHLIKRVMGLPGDRVACCDPQGRITINGAPVQEPYLYPGDEPSEEEFSVTVPEGRLWVMGDHRHVSQDSRAHRELADGTVAVDDVVGKAFVVVWPFDRGGLLRNPSASFSGVSGP